jgi:hypothetical protein
VCSESVCYGMSMGQVETHHMVSAEGVRHDRHVGSACSHKPVSTLPASQSYVRSTLFNRTLKVTSLSGTKSVVAHQLWPSAHCNDHTSAHAS